MSQRLFGAAMILLMILASVGHSQEKKLEPLNVSYASVSGTRIPLWIAKDTGLFEKHGLDVKLVSIASGSTSIQALLGGGIQVVAASGSAAVAAAARGAPVVIIASFGPIAYKLIALPSITSIQELKGKTIGSSRPGAGSDFALRRLLPKLGLIPDRDVTIIPTGLSESDRRLIVMFQGKIDATIGTVDNILELELKGQRVSVLADLLEAGVYTTGSDVSTTRAFIKNHPQSLKAFLKAFSEGIWNGRNDRELTYRIARKYLKIEDPRLLESIHKNYLLGTIPVKPYPREEALQTDIEDLSATSPEIKGRKASEFMDTSLLREIEEEGFFARLQR